MTDTLQSQLRITAWPGVPLPLPVAVKLESRLDLDDGVIVPCYAGEGSWVNEEEVILSGETYLRLAEVDLDDPEAIFAFTSAYGPLGGADMYGLIEQQPVLRFLTRQELDPGAEERKKERALLAELDRAVGFDRSELEGPEAPADFLRQLRVVNPDMERVFTHHAETLDEFRFAARCINYVTAAWKSLRYGTDLPGYEWGTLDMPPGLEKMKLTGELLAGALGSFLYPFNPQFSIQWSWEAGKPPPSEWSRAFVDVQRGPTRVHLYTICALELFNHIIDNAEYHTCANENCQRTFVHQQGRAVKGQNRSRGVLYCSPSCARATAQREYRRRRFNQRPPASS